MALRPLPADYADGDTPTHDELNGLKDHAGNHVEQLLTVLTRNTLIQQVSTNTMTAVSWQAAVNNRNGLGWTVGSPTRLTVPPGGAGVWSVNAGLQLEATSNTGFRQVQLTKNGNIGIPGLAVPGSTAVYGVLSVTWELDLVVGDYLEVHVWQNSGVTINLMVFGSRPQVSMRRVAL